MTFTQWIDKLIEKKMRRINTGLICKIEKFDTTTFRADVKPLMKHKNAYNEETDYPLITDIPVIIYKQGDYFIKPNYVAGDLVWVGFSSFDIEDALKEYSRAESKKTFEIQNACILGTIAKDNYVATAAMQQQGVVMGLATGLPEPALKAQTYLNALNIYLTAMGAVVGSANPAQNGGAINAMVAAANAFKAALTLVLSQDVYNT